MKNKVSKIIVSSIIIFICIILLVVGVVIGRKIVSRYNAENKPYLYLNERAVSKVEYDYYYYSYYNSYMANYSFAMSYLIDPDKDIMDQIREDNETYGDYFKRCAIEQLIKINALYEDGHNNDFVYDSEDEYDVFIDKVEESCKNAGTSVDTYFQKFYGEYATKDNISQFLKQGFYANKYNDYLSEKLKDDENAAFNYVNKLKDDYEVKYAE